ncbi:ubiquitin-related domain-containing protein [Haematococcus lacustris]
MCSQLQCLAPHGCRTEDAPAGPVLWNLFVHTLAGKRLHLHTLHGASLVEDLMQAVQDIEGIPPDRQRLTFAGRRLMDEQLLQDCGIHDGSVIHLVLKICGD